MVYILVLFGSFFGICAILGMRVALKNRNIRKFVRGIRQRTEKARERGLTMRETRIAKPSSNPRTFAVEMQKSRSLLREAEKMMARRQYDDVERLLIQALTVTPTSIEVRAHLAKLYLVMDRDAKAEALYRELLLEEVNISFHANLGLACYKQGKFGEACISYNNAFQMDSKNPERAAMLGKSCIAAKRYAEAIELLEFATERLARDVELLGLLGSCYEMLGNNPAAQEAYRKIHRLQPYDENVKKKLEVLASM